MYVLNSILYNNNNYNIKIIIIIIIIIIITIYIHVLTYHVINLPRILQHLNYHSRQHAQEDLHAVCVEYRIAIMYVKIIRLTIQCINQFFAGTAQYSTSHCNCIKFRKMVNLKLNN